MKKLVKIFLPAILLMGLVYAGYRMIKISEDKKVQSQRIARIPAFRLKTLHGADFTNTDLAQDKPVVFLYFNSDCDFCQAETEEIIRNIAKFDRTQLIYVSFEPADKIALFQKKYHLDKYDNVTFLKDSKYEFSKLFGVSTLPSSLVYGKDGTLLCRNNGVVKVDYLLKAIN
jgi:peroxiredoxin